MPWTKQAFIFHMFHLSLELYLGAFDFDDGVDEHDLIGRVAVNVLNLQPDTTYVLTYNLYQSGKHTLHEPQGTVTIRIRMEIDNDRQLLLSTLELPKTIYVNVKSKTRSNCVISGLNCGKYSCQNHSNFAHCARHWHFPFQKYQDPNDSSWLLWNGSKICSARLLYFLSGCESCQSATVPLHSITL